MGGNVFKDLVTGESLTKRIDRIDVAPTIKLLEVLTGLDLWDNLLGTTGKAETSGDIDVAVDETLRSKDDLVTLLTRWADYRYSDGTHWVKKSGISVHHRTPIRGTDALGFVQVDFMFGDPEWLKWSLRGETTPGFAGRHRHILLSNLAKNNNVRWSPNKGVMTRNTNIVLSTDTDAVAKYLLDNDATSKDLDNIDSIMYYVMKFPSWQRMLVEAEETLSHEGISLLERYDVDRQRIPTP
jgi:hypothetical protein